MEIARSLDIRGDLFVAAGSRLRVGPDVTVTVRGRLMLEGRNDAPITVERADPARAWGSLVILGRGGDGSRLTHCAISGGSGQKGNFHLFSGMLEIRNVHDLAIENCSFRDNETFDDMVHLAYVEGVVRDTRIENAVSDCIDLDISHVRFERVKISGCGNDGIDLMTSRVLVKDSEIVAAKDKGISIGEKTALRVSATTFRNNEIGLQGKDGSTVYVDRSELIDNKIQVSGYHKNKRYSGDVLMVLKDVQIGGQQKAVFDLKDNSNVFIFGGRLPPSLRPDNVHIEPPAGSAIARRAASVIDEVGMIDAELSELGK